jgi:hypothetical protein
MDIDGRSSLTKKRKETTMQTKSKKLLTIAFAAVALTTASLATTGEALAHGNGGKFFRSRVIVVPATVGSSCYWKWINYKKVWFCY